MQRLQVEKFENREIIETKFTAVRVRPTAYSAQSQRNPIQIRGRVSRGHGESSIMLSLVRACVQICKLSLYW